MIFLDRDGVINQDSDDYIRSLEDWKPIPGSLDAIARLYQAGYVVVVVSNQSGLARGYFDRVVVDDIHATLCSQVAELGGDIAGIYICPHHPEEGCACRKPEPGLVREAERSLGVSARGAPMVGDKLSDIEAARRAGCRPILVRTGKGSRYASDAPELVGVEIYRDLGQAVDRILARVA